jgi:hypothetical protein
MKQYPWLTDQTINRYFVARKKDEVKGLEMLGATLAW